MALDADGINEIEQDHIVLENELNQLEETHKEYQTHVQKANKIQQKLSDTIQKKLTKIKELRIRLKKNETHSDIETNLKYRIEQQIEFRYSQLLRFKDTLPKTGGLYLRVILGLFNVNLIKREARLLYKEEYERFKLILNLIICILSFITLVFNYRALDATLHFLLVWYHCTLTIRESILIVNGSRINGWWRALQFITTIQAGIIILWPDGKLYNDFRSQFLLYTIYTAFLQYLQFYYQHNCLYRLRALGYGYDMDVTLQGFHSWMWRGLSFLLPVLYVGYVLQLYSAYKLYQLHRESENFHWQVITTAIIYFIIFIGNMFTTTLVVVQKIRHGISTKLRALAATASKDE